MPTDQEIDPSETTVTEEVTPPSSEDAQPTEEVPTETVEELKEKLAAAETEKNRWKNRLEKANEKKPKAVAPADLEELEWKLENKDRITLVKDEYEKLVADGYQGEPVSRRIALELAEKLSKVDSNDTKRVRHNEMTVPSVTNRNVDPKGYESDTDKALGLTQEKIRKLEERHPHLKAA